MLRLLYCEYIKLKRSKILLIGIAGTLIVPFFVIGAYVSDAVICPNGVDNFTCVDNQPGIYGQNFEKYFCYSGFTDSLSMRKAVVPCNSYVPVHVGFLAGNSGIGAFVRLFYSRNGAYASLRFIFPVQNAFWRIIIVRYSNAVCLSYNKNEGICRAACYRFCNQLN